MASNRNFNRGFSLIELLVVMVILGVTLSVVAPNIFALKTRFDIEAEKKLIKQFLYQQSYASYFQEEEQSIDFIGALVVSSFENELTLKHLSFPKQVIYIDRYGKFPLFELKYIQNEQLLTLEIEAP